MKKIALFLALIFVGSVAGQPVQRLNNVVVQNAGTNLTGLLKTNGATASTAAVAGTDYLAAAVVPPVFGGLGVDASALTGVAVFNAGTGSVDSVLAPVFGGLGLDASAATGVATFNAGTPTIETILSPIFGGLGVDASAATGVPTFAAGVPTIQTTVPPVFGGLGVDASALTGVAVFNAGTGSVDSVLAPVFGGLGLDASASSGVPLFTAGVPAFTSTTGTGVFVRQNNAELFDATLFNATINTLNGGTPAILENANIFTNQNDFNGATFNVSPASVSGSSNAYINILPNNRTAIPAVEAIGISFNSAGKQWTGSGTINLQREISFLGPTYTATAATRTFTDVFTLAITPPTSGTNVSFTRRHTLGVIGPTSAANSITGELIVATTLGNAVTSVGIGGGNVNAGGTVTGATVSSTGTLSGVTTNITGTATFTGAMNANGSNATTAFTSTQVARTTGVLPYFQIQTPADTGRTASTEAPGFRTLTATRTWATTGTVAVQREYLFAAPTYASASASQTFTTAATVAISGAPIQGTNAILTLPLALWVQSGRAQFDGGIGLSKTITPGGTTGAQVINNASGSVNFAAAATSLVVTNSLVSTSSIIQATVGTNDATMKSVAAVAAAGSFTLFANVAPTAETRVNFIVSN